MYASRLLLSVCCGQCACVHTYCAPYTDRRSRRPVRFDIARVTNLTPLITNLHSTLHSDAAGKELAEQKPGCGGFGKGAFLVAMRCVCWSVRKRIVGSIKSLAQHFTSYTRKRYTHTSTGNFSELFKSIENYEKELFDAVTPASPSA